MEYTTGGHETMDLYLKENGYQSVNVSYTDKKYYTRKESGAQIKVDEYSGKIILMDKHGNFVQAKRVFSKSELDRHTY